MKINIGLIQPKVGHYQVDSNLGMYADRLIELKQAGVRLAVLPEFFPTGNTLEPRLLQTAVRTGVKTAQWMEDQAAALDMVIAGSYLCPENGRVYNRFAIQAPGRPLIRRRKSFIPAAEKVYSLEADDAPIVETSLGKIGLIMCAETFAPKIVCADYSGCVLILIAFAIPNLFAQTPGIRDRLTNLPRLLAEKWGVPVILCSMGGRFSTKGSLAAPLIWRGNYAGRSGVYLPDESSIGPLAPGSEGVLTADVDLSPSKGANASVKIPSKLPVFMSLYDRVFEAGAKAIYIKQKDAGSPLAGHPEKAGPPLRG
ncbi:carbon-nitrogen hydrolase family protein [Desulfatibacillum aliphaticivorans]|uniref:carbon-nitrogen hydrolase family protein n=1 Tax=Desulfatibacillum aliphaticivorans TaxID=218208 RepID=UPI00040AAE83|nr:carbon-nitrogen hydrolase family protein [Desulfatibacillum aliphaticivorans]